MTEMVNQTNDIYRSKNLISNAIKFSNMGGVIEINEYVEAGAIKISVKDFGIGVAEDKISELMNFSFNNKQPGTEGELGTGLGLTLCMDFIHRNSGKLQ